MAETSSPPTKAPEKTKRNYQIDILRLFFCIFVILGHTSSLSSVMPEKTHFLKAGYIAVFFFFTVSGYLMLETFKGKTESCSLSAWNFIFSKIKTLAKDYIGAMVIAYVVNFTMLLSDSDTNSYINIIKSIILTTIKSITDFLGIFAVGNFPSMNAPAWYISAMLIAMLPLYYILCKNKHFYLYILCPLAVLFLFGYRYMTFSDFTDNPQEFTGVMSLGIIKAVSGICAGGISWIIAHKLKETELTRFGTTMLSIAELFLFALITVSSLFVSDDRVIRFDIQFCFIPYVAIVFSGKSIFFNLFDKKIFGILGKWSLPLFLNHITAKVIIMSYFADNEFWENFVYLIMLSIILSLIEYYGVRLIIKLFKLIPLRLTKPKEI